MTEISIQEASRAQYPDVDSFYRRCGYSRRLGDEDTVLTAVRGRSLVGVVRLCPENGVVVLRGMQVLSEFQRQRIGIRLLQECLPVIGNSTCYCVPWTHLEQFYGTGGFIRCEPAHAPDFLKDRYAGYLADGLDVILMQKE